MMRGHWDRGNVEGIGEAPLAVVWHGSRWDWRKLIIREYSSRG